jgi:hypothetical protein
MKQVFPTVRAMLGAMQAGYAVSSANAEDIYRAAACRLYKFTLDHNNPHSVTMVEFGAFVDVYEGLEVFTADELSADAIGLGIVTTGWAAPIPEGHTGEDDELTAPSAHPERRRVILFTCRTLSGDCHSVIDMQGNDEVIEQDSGRGPLAEALEYALRTASKVTA